MALVQGDTPGVVASKAGAPTSPDWYHNLVANPEVEVEFGDEHFSATAVPIVSGPERDRLYAPQVVVQPGFAGLREGYDEGHPRRGAPPHLIIGRPFTPAGG